MESVVYLYSKYSSKCKEFSNVITTTTLNDSFNRLCIDNKDIRKVAVESKYSIKSLPCVLCFFPNTVVEKYEGDQAFRWLAQFVIQTPPPPPPPVFYPKLEPTVKQEEMDDEEEPLPPPKKKTRKQISNESTAQKTSIEDILASSVNEEDDENEEEEDTVQELKSTDINTMIKKSTKQSKASDIMTRAQQLQKMREEEETEKTKKK